MGGPSTQFDLFGSGGRGSAGGDEVPGGTPPSAPWESALPGPSPDAGAPPSPPPASAPELLHGLRARGATRLQRVRLRSNRTVLWSLTDGGRTLNLHRAYAAAPPAVLDAFALLAGGGRRGSPEVRRAALRVRNWPPALEAIRDLRGEEVSAALAVAQGEAPGPSVAGSGCVARPGERDRIVDLYRRLNHERFEGCLPPEVPLRLSGRMRRRLGHMRPGTGEGEIRVVVEIALNHDLLAPGNELLLVDTLLHEMAHAADWLLNGRAGHGRSWKLWALRVGCHPTACTNLPFRATSRAGGKGRKNPRRPRG